MSSLIDQLPGQRLPIAQVNQTLAKMWQGEGPDIVAPSEFRASQMNLILHFGKSVSPDEARETFDTAIRFSQRYPCRIIVLCPEFDPEAAERPLEGKLYTQCFIGDELRDMCCVEALMLAYFTGQNDFLENQVSVWLESDLPTYYWFVKMSTKRIQERFLPFLKQCRRVVYDASIEKDDYRQIEWHRRHQLSDLAWARTLPIRQGVGQYLSALPPQQLGSGLRQVELAYHPHYFGEARALYEWFTDCAFECIRVAGENAEAFEMKMQIVEDSSILLLKMNYQDGRYFSWQLEPSDNNAHLSGNFGHGEIHEGMNVSFLDAEKALAEALFFAD